MGFTVEELAKEAGVSLAYLKRQISDKHILEFAKHCIPFELIGPYLGLENHDLDSIDADGRKTALKRKATLEVWKEKKTFQATYRAFIQALISCDKNDSAYQVCQALAQEEKGRWLAAFGSRQVASSSSHSCLTIKKDLHKQ